MSTFVKGEKIKYPTITEDMAELIKDENSPYVWKLSKAKFDLTKYIGCPYLYFIDMLLPIVAVDESGLMCSYSYSYFDGTVWMWTSVQVIIESIDDEYFGVKVENSVLQSPFGASTETDNNVFDKIGLIESVKEEPEITISEQAKTNFKTNMGSFADWNAQVGEAGYIENRTHSAEFTRIEYDQENNKGKYETAVPVDKLLLLWRKKYFTVHKNIPLTIDVNDGEDTFIVNYNGTTLYITDNNGYLYDEHEYISVSETNIPLAEAFIPDTVLKTTSQTLSDGAKNQALANLGIDPVVWKYMCNPFDIWAGSESPYESTIDPELVGEKDEHSDLGEVYHFKYLIPLMYRYNYIQNVFVTDTTGYANGYTLSTYLNDELVQFYIKKSDFSETGYYMVMHTPV